MRLKTSTLVITNEPAQPITEPLHCETPTSVDEIITLGRQVLENIIITDYGGPKEEAKIFVRLHAYFFIPTENLFFDFNEYTSEKAHCYKESLIDYLDLLIERYQGLQLQILLKEIKILTLACNWEDFGAISKLKADCLNILEITWEEAIFAEIYLRKKAKKQ
ncbi:hypothetical protein IT412_00200 [Candidatus Peregrinibacteria bacterium]|nr:hypothetical protein [Candidatus Peregrinibacteria bacterium]